MLDGLSFASNETYDVCVITATSLRLLQVVILAPKSPTLTLSAKFLPPTLHISPSMAFKRLRLKKKADQRRSNKVGMRNAARTRILKSVGTF